MQQLRDVDEVPLGRAEVVHPRIPFAVNDARAEPLGGEQRRSVPYGSR